MCPSHLPGWTVIRHDFINNGNKITSWLYFHVAGGSEPASYAWTLNPQYVVGRDGRIPGSGEYRSVVGSGRGGT